MHRTFSYTQTHIKTFVDCVNTVFETYPNPGKIHWSVLHRSGEELAATGKLRNAITKLDRSFYVYPDAFLSSLNLVYADKKAGPDSNEQPGFCFDNG